MRPDVLADYLAQQIIRRVAPMDLRVKGHDHKIQALEDKALAALELADLVGDLRERLAVVESRAPEPGPPGPPGPPGDAGQNGAPGLVYRGPHEVGKTYEVGDCVYTGGSSWVAVTTTTAAPSTASRDWGLVASRGRDGKREPRP